MTGQGLGGVSEANGAGNPVLCDGRPRGRAGGIYYEGKLGEATEAVPGNDVLTDKLVIFPMASYPKPLNAFGNGDAKRPIV